MTSGEGVGEADGIGEGVAEGVGIGLAFGVTDCIGAGPRRTSPWTSRSPTAIVIADFAREVMTNS